MVITRAEMWGTPAKVAGTTVQPWRHRMANIFWDNFSVIIDCRKYLSEICKFSCLPASLKGEAKACLQGLSLTEANYTQAKQQLLQQFDHKEKIITNHIQKLNISIGYFSSMVWMM